MGKDFIIPEGCLFKIHSEKDSKTFVIENGMIKEVINNIKREDIHFNDRILIFNFEQSPADMWVEIEHD